MLPVTRPVGNIQRGIIAGKLKGAMPAHTPSGTLEDQDHRFQSWCHLWLVRSMSLLIPVRVSPNIKVVFAHRDSTTLGCIPDNQMTGRLLPGDPSSHLLLHLGVFYPAREIRNTSDLATYRLHWEWAS